MADPILDAIDSAIATAARTKPKAADPVISEIDSILNQFGIDPGADERMQSYASNAADQGTPWESASAEMQKLFGRDPSHLAKQYQLQFQMGNERRKASGEGEPLALKIANAADVGGFLGFAMERRYGQAMRNIQAGTPQGDDIAFKEQYERIQKIKQDESTGEAIVRAGSQVPGFLLGAKGGGKLWEGGRRLLKGAEAVKDANKLWKLEHATMNAPGRVLHSTPDQIGQTALAPVFWAEMAARNYNEAPKDRGELEKVSRAFGAAFTYGVAQNAIVGQLTAPGRKLPWMAEVPKRTGISVLEQQAADVLAGVSNIKTDYGAMGEFFKKDGRPFHHLAIQTATFAMFASMHGKDGKKAAESAGKIIDKLGPEQAGGLFDQIGIHAKKDWEGFDEWAATVPPEVKVEVEAIKAAIDPGKPVETKAQASAKKAATKSTQFDKTARKIEKDEYESHIADGKKPDEARALAKQAAEEWKAGAIARAAQQTTELVPAAAEPVAPPVETPPVPPPDTPVPPKVGQVDPVSETPTAKPYFPDLPDVDVTRGLGKELSRLIAVRGRLEDDLAQEKRAADPSTGAGERKMVAESTVRTIQKRLNEVNAQFAELRDKVLKYDHGDLSFKDKGEQIVWETQYDKILGKLGDYKHAVEAAKHHAARAVAIHRSPGEKQARLTKKYIDDLKNYIDTAQPDYVPPPDDDVPVETTPEPVESKPVTIEDALRDTFLSAEERFAIQGRLAANSYRVLSSQSGGVNPGTIYKAARRAFAKLKSRHPDLLAGHTDLDSYLTDVLKVETSPEDMADIAKMREEFAPKRKSPRHTPGGDPASQNLIKKGRDVQAEVDQAVDEALAVAQSGQKKANIQGAVESAVDDAVRALTPDEAADPAVRDAAARIKAIMDDPKISPIGKVTLIKNIKAQQERANAAAKELAVKEGQSRVDEISGRANQIVDAATQAGAAEPAKSGVDSPTGTEVKAPDAKADIDIVEDLKATQARFRTLEGTYAEQQAEAEQIAAKIAAMPKPQAVAIAKGFTGKGGRNSEQAAKLVKNDLLQVSKSVAENQWEYGAAKTKDGRWFAPDLISPEAMAEREKRDADRVVREAAEAAAKREAEANKPPVGPTGRPARGGGILRKTKPTHPDKVGGLATSAQVKAAIAVPDPVVESRIGDSHGIAKKTLGERIRRRGNILWHKFTRQAIHLDYSEQWADAREGIRLLKSVGKYASDQSHRKMMAIIDPLGPNQLALFERWLLAHDAKAAAASGQYIPHGWKDAKQIDDYIQVLKPLVDATPEVQKALADHEVIRRDVVSEGMKYDIYTQDALDNKDYWHRMVRAGERMERYKSMTLPLLLKRSSMRARTEPVQGIDWGPELDPNTSYIETTAHWMTEAHAEIQKEKIFRDFFEPYDHLESLKDEAEQSGLKRSQWREMKKNHPDLLPWSPSPGNVFFNVHSIPDKLAADIIQLGAQSVDAQHIKEALAIGGMRREMMLHVDLIRQLDSMLRPPEDDSIARRLMGAWKAERLFAPARLAGYKLRNFIGDLDPIIAAEPGVMKEFADSAEELWNFYYSKSAKGSLLSPELRAAQELDVIASSLAVVDIPDIKDLPIFRRFYKEAGTMSKLNPVKLAGEYMKWAKKFNEFTEGIMRYAAFKHYLKKINAGESLHFGGSRASHVQELLKTQRPEVAAANLARNLLGDYGGLTEIGEWAATHVAPFYRWIEVNFKRWPRIVANAYEHGGTKKAAKVVGLKAGAVSALMTMRVGALYAAAWLWNNTVMGDVERELSDEEKASLHLNLPFKNADGSNKVFRRVGALSDFLEWFGVEEVIEQWDNLQAGQVEPENLAYDMGKSTYNKAVQAFRPDVKTALETGLGRRVFPEIWRSRPARRDEILAQPFGLTQELRRAKDFFGTGDTSTKSSTQLMQAAGVSSIHPGKEAVNEVRTLMGMWDRKRGKDPEDPHPPGAIAKMRAAMDVDDREAFKNAKDVYLKDGGNIAKLIGSLDRMDPIKKLSETDRKAFYRFLTDEQRDVLKKAREYTQSERKKFAQWWRETK